MIVFLCLVWSLIFLYIIHIHLSYRDQLLVSSWADTLQTLSELLPSQSEQLASSILKATGVLTTSTITTIEREVAEELKQAEEHPFVPPWENIEPTDVNPRGQWGEVDETNT